MTIPIPESPDVTQIERMRPLVEGQHIVVVGSAPLPTPTAEIRPGEYAIAVNGGISSLDPTVWPPAVWVLNSKQQDRPKDPALKPLHKAMLKQGKQRTAGHLLLLRGPAVASEGFTLAALDKQGTIYKSWSVLDKVTKRWFEGQVCGRVRDNRPCSAGILTVAIALWCGAAHVRMDGFSFAPGYHYLPNDAPAYWWRDHIEADQRALRALSATYADRLSGPLLRQVAA